MDFISRGDAVILLRVRFDEATQRSTRERVGALSRRRPGIPEAVAARLEPAEHAEVQAFLEGERAVTAKQDEVAALTLMDSVTRAARHLAAEQDDAARYRLQAAFRNAARVLARAASPKGSAES